MTLITRPCGLCKEKAESVTHVATSCSVLAGNQYKERHDKLGKKVQLILSKNYEIECEVFHTSTRASAGESEMEITLELCNPDR